MKTSKNNKFIEKPMPQIVYLVFYKQNPKMPTLLQNK